MRVEHIGDASIWCGDVLEVLGGLPDESVNCVVTSPPYWGLRDYGVSGQIGLEKTPEEYVKKMVTVLEEVRRVLRKDGTCWVNLGDNYAASQYGSGGGWAKKPAIDGIMRNNRSLIDPVKLNHGLKPKDLVGIPWRIAFALQAAGWWLRQDIIWSKPNPMPESVRDRCTKSHEYVFMFTKSARYWFDAEAIKEEAAFREDERPFGSAGGNRHGDEGRLYQGGKTSWRGNRTTPREKRKSFDHSQGGGGNRFIGHSGIHDAEGNIIGGPKRNKRDVWEIATQPFSAAHFATYPEKLVEPCILAGCPEGGTVLDPFHGAGTTGVVALNHCRKYIGIELKQEYIDISLPRIRQAWKHQARLFKTLDTSVETV